MEGQVVNRIGQAIIHEAGQTHQAAFHGAAGPNTITCKCGNPTKDDKGNISCPKCTDEPNSTTKRANP